MNNVIDIKGHLKKAAVTPYYRVLTDFFGNNHVQWLTRYQSKLSGKMYEFWETENG